MTDSAVRRKGEGVAIRYCVMCLADDEKRAAVCVIAVGDGDVEAGYCRACAETMKRCGHTDVRPLPAGENGSKGEVKKRGLTIRQGAGRPSKFTDEQRAEIVASAESAETLAVRYGVHFTTIYDVRKKAREAALAAAVAEHGPEAIEEAVEVPEELTYRESHRALVSGAFHEGTIEECMACGPIALRRARATEPEPAEAPVEPANQPCRYCGTTDDGPFRYYDGSLCGPCYNSRTPAEPESRNREAFRRLISDEDAPAPAAIGNPPFGSTYHSERPEPVMVAITLNMTHTAADAIWDGLSLEEKATFCRAKIIERLELMA